MFPLSPSFRPSVINNLRLTRQFSVQRVTIAPSSVAAWVKRVLPERVGSTSAASTYIHGCEAVALCWSQLFILDAKIFHRFSRALDRTPSICTLLFCKSP